MEKEIKIRIRDLHKSFGKKNVLNGVNLDLYKGESLVVIGGSGTGKSVLIKCIQGLLTPDSGSIEIDDIEIVNENPDVIDRMHSKMGMLFQGGALLLVPLLHVLKSSFLMNRPLVLTLLWRTLLMI